MRVLIGKLGLELFLLLTDLLGLALQTHRLAQEPVPLALESLALAR